MNPYQQNIDIIKGFFKQKIVLLYAILTILPIFSIIFININDLIIVTGNFMGEKILGNVPREFNVAGVVTSCYSLFIFEILLAVIFLLFYVKSGSDEGSLNVPIKMFRIVSVIEIIIMALISMAMVFVVLVMSLHTLATHSTLVSILVVPLIILAIPAILLTIFSQTLFAETIKVSANSIYLKKTGTKLYGVMNGIMAFACVYIAILLAIYGQSVISMIVPLFALLALSAVKYAAGAVLGIKYATYIEGYSDSSTAKENSEQPEHEEAAEKTSNIIVCKKCGKALTADDYFCNHCGTPVEK